MAYSRREVINHKTIIDKDHYDNLQDGIDEALQRILELQQLVEQYSIVTAPDGSLYSWGVDEVGVYLQSVSLDDSEGDDDDSDVSADVVMLDLTDDVDTGYYVEFTDGETKSVENIVNSEDELTDGSYLIETL